MPFHKPTHPAPVGAVVPSVDKTDRAVIKNGGVQSHSSVFYYLLILLRGGKLFLADTAQRAKAIFPKYLQK